MHLPRVRLHKFRYLFSGALLLAHLSVEQTTNFKFVVNINNAKALGPTIPEMIQ